MLNKEPEKAAIKKKVMKKVLKNLFIWLVMLPGMVFTGCTAPVSGDKVPLYAGVSYDVTIKPGNVSYGTHSTAAVPMVSPMRSHGTSAPMVTGGAVRSYAHHGHATMPNTSAYGSAVPSGKGLYTTSTATVYSIGSGGGNGGGGFSSPSGDRGASSRGITYGGGGAVSMPVLALATTSSSASATTLQASSMTAPSSRSMGPRRIYDNGEGEYYGEPSSDGNKYWDGEDWVDYKENDTKIEDGKTYVYHNGAWVLVSDQTDPDTPIGDTPWLFFLLLAAGYTAVKLRQKPHRLSGGSGLFPT